MLMSWIMTNTKALQKTSTHLSHTKNAIVNQAQGKAMMLGNLGIKSVMLAEMGDGAYTDDCVKIKPNREGEGLVLKCTCLERLKAALVQAGFNPKKVEIRKGKKHFVAFIRHNTSKALSLVK